MIVELAVLYNPDLKKGVEFEYRNFTTGHIVLLESDTIEDAIAEAGLAGWWVAHVVSPYKVWLQREKR